MDPKIKLPTWHEDARRMRASGMGLQKIADTLGEAGINVSTSRVSQVTGQNWEKYLSKQQIKAQAEAQELIKAKKEGRLPDLKSAVFAAYDEAHRSVDMPDRQFEELPMEPGITNQRVRIRCGHSGCTNSLIFSKHGDINYVQAARWFRDKGWLVGGGFRADRCPDHAFRKAKSNGHAEELKPEPAPEPEPVAEPHVIPQEVIPPSRTEKRIVHVKLEETYVDEVTGYKVGWTDQKIADDLGVPVEWVTVIREDSFGPDKHEEDVIDLYKEVFVLADTIRPMVDDVLVKMIDIKGRIEQIDKLWDQLDPKLDEYEVASQELKIKITEYQTKVKELECNRNQTSILPTTSSKSH